MLTKIPKKSLDKPCRMGQGAKCCKYMVVDGARGICCAKGSELQANIDNTTTMVARGDNCRGLNNGK